MGLRLGVLLLGMVLSGHAAADTPVPHTTVSIVAVDPVDGATLHGSDSVHVHVHYVSDAPIKVWVRPYFQGKEVPAMTNGSFGHPAGEGEAFGWFACSQACQVDSIHLQVAGMDSGYPFMEQAEPADFTWDGTPGAAHAPAAWVKPMQDEEKKRQEQAYKEQMAKPVGTGGAVLVSAFGLVVLAALAACFVWPIWGVIRWRDKWRWLAAAPLALVVFKTLGLLVDLSRDRTSHNLLPFEYLMLGALIAPYMLIVWFMRRRALNRVEA